MTRSLRAPERGEETAGDEPAGPDLPEGLDRFRIVVAAAMGTVLVSYALLVPPALVVVLAGGTGGSLDAAFAAAVPLWLAAHQIPLVLEGRPFGLLPLLPTLAVIAVVAVGSRWAVRKLGGRIRHDAGAVLAAATGSHAAVAVLGSALLPSSAEVGAAPWAAMLGAGLVAAVGAAIGVAGRCGLPAGWRERLAGWPAAGFAGAAVGGAALLVLGSLALLVGLVVGASRVHAAYESLAPTAGGAAGVTLLALGYLPNAVVAGVSWVLGPGVGIGLGTWSVFGGLPAPLPPFPLLAALPTVPAPPWAVAVVVLPVGVGLVVGGICRTALGPVATMAERLRAVGCAAGTLAGLTGLAAVLAGGRLAGGNYDPVAVPAVGVVIAVLLTIGAPAAVVALVQRGGPPPADDRDLGWYRDGYTEDGGASRSGTVGSADAAGVETGSAEPSAPAVRGSESAQGADGGAAEPSDLDAAQGVEEADPSGAEPSERNTEPADPADAEPTEVRGQAASAPGARARAALDPRANTSAASDREAKTRAGSPPASARKGAPAPESEDPQLTGAADAAESGRTSSPDTVKPGRTSSLDVAESGRTDSPDASKPGRAVSLDTSKPGRITSPDSPEEPDRNEQPSGARSPRAREVRRSATARTRTSSTPEGPASEAGRSRRDRRAARKARPSDTPLLDTPLHDTPTAAPEAEPRPRTVGELVALRKRQEEERAARESGA